MNFLVFKKIIAFMYKNMYKLVINKTNTQMSLHRSVHLMRMNMKLMNWKLMNWKLSYRNWQFLSQQEQLSIKISFWESSFAEICQGIWTRCTHANAFPVCNKINPQVSLHRSIRLIWMNRKLMNRKSMNRKLSYRNWKTKLSWTNLKFGNFRRPILFSVSFD